MKTTKVTKVDMKEVKGGFNPAFKTETAAEGRAAYNFISYFCRVDPTTTEACK